MLEIVELLFEQLGVMGSRDQRAASLLLLVAFAHFPPSGERQSGASSRRLRVAMRGQRGGSLRCGERGTQGGGAE